MTRRMNSFAEEDFKKNTGLYLDYMHQADLPSWLKERLIKEFMISQLAKENPGKVFMVYDIINCKPEPCIYMPEGVEVDTPDNWIWDYTKKGFDVPGKIRRYMIFTRTENQLQYLQKCEEGQ